MTGKYTHARDAGQVWGPRRRRWRFPFPSSWWALRRRSANALRCRCRKSDGGLGRLGLDVPGELMTAEVAEFARAKGKHDVERTHLRHGTEREATAQRSSSTSRSSVSRRFVAATGARLHALMSRRIDDERWLIVFIEGSGFAGHTLVGTLGVTAEGRKLPLTVVAGSTENKTLATRRSQPRDDAASVTG